MMRILVLGAGSIGRRHADNAGALGADVTLLPYRSLPAGGVAEWLDRNPKPDGAVIATATKIREPVIAPLAASGVPMYLEKPLAVDTAELSALEQNLAPVAEWCLAGFMMRYHPTVKTLARSDLSSIYAAQFEIGHDVTQWRQNWTFAGSYAADPRGGGVLLDLCHELDLAMTLFPDAQLQSVRSLAHSQHPNVDFHTTIGLSAGAEISVSMDYLNPTSTRAVRLRGTRWSMDVDLLNGLALGDGIALPDLSNFERNDMFLAAMQDFFRLIQGEKPANPIAPTLSNALKSSQLIAAAWEKRQFVGQVEKDLS